jgi:hypothetical protein
VFIRGPCRERLGSAQFIADEAARNRKKAA